MIKIDLIFFIIIFIVFTNTILVTNVYYDNNKQLIYCNDTNDCLHYFGDLWCQSGFICILNKCHKVDDIPCLHTQICQEDSMKCIDKKCLKDNDCDDKLFCNGNEKCDSYKSICIPVNNSSCRGYCSEYHKKCLQKVGFKKNPKLVIDMEFHENDEEIIPLKYKEFQYNDEDVLLNSIVEVQDLPVTISSGGFVDFNNTTVQAFVFLGIGASLLFSIIICLLLAFGTVWARWTNSN